MYALALVLPFLAGAFASPISARWASSGNGSPSDPLPFADGFPSPSKQQVSQIELQAHGLLPQGIPPTLSPIGVTNVQLVEFAERTEAVFFEEFLFNVTNKVPGYDVLPPNIDYDDLVMFLNQSVAMEELHSLAGTSILAHFNQTDIQPCTQYNFPVSNIAESLTLAAVTQSVVFGTLGDLALRWAENGDFAFVQIAVQIAAAEGEQAGKLRTLLNKTSIELPFTTQNSIDFTFTALQGFVVPSSCPNLNAINLTTFEPLTVLSNLGPQDSQAQFQIGNSKYQSGSKYWVVYLNGLSIPIVEPLAFVTSDSETVTLQGSFPYTEHEMNGLTIAAITDTQGPFSSAEDVAAAAIWAPGLILVN